MISQTQTASNQYGFYAVPKKLQPKKKYRQTQYQDFYDHNNQQQNQFQPIDKQPVPQNLIERDFYVDQAPYPEFKPKQRGLDYGVQIQKGDLFDFDLQVQPLLQILVGRSVVSAINQLQQEKQKIQKKQKLQTYQKKRNAELMVTQRLQAKSKRKKQQSERRVLQKQIFVKNQKQAGKKIIARKTAKKNLLGLRNEVLSQLQQAGYLRSQPYTDLRINFQGWLYDQITSMIREDNKIKSQVQKMVRQVQNQKEDEHKKKIQKQKKRRQDILDQRQRIRKLNEERKQKKRIKKQRLQLNSQRQANAIKFDQLLQKYTQLDSILKFENRSNGFSSNGSNQVHISGGLINFVITILNSQSRSNYSPQQIQTILTKIINQSPSPIQIQFLQQHYNIIQEQLQQLNTNPNEYMNNKIQKISSLLNKISLNLKLLQLTKINIKAQLHDALLQAVLNILFTNVNIIKGENQTQENLYVPNQKDKLRQELKKKIQINPFNNQQLEQIQTILRVRFQRKQLAESQQKSQIKQASQDEWVDVYDGQGWSHHIKQLPQQISRDEQKPAAIAVQGFDKSYVYDERILYYLRRQLQRLLQTQSGQEVEKYVQGLSNLGGALKINVPTYDGQLRISE